MNDKFPFKNKFHIIFCRNVMIYFDRETRLKEIKKLHTFYIKEVKPIMKNYLQTQAKAWLVEEKPEAKQYFG